MRTAKNVESMMRVHLADWQDRPLSGIVDDDITALHESIGKNRGRYVANRVGQLLRAVFNFGMHPKRSTSPPAPLRISNSSRSGHDSAV